MNDSLNHVSAAHQFNYTRITQDAWIFINSCVIVTVIITSSALCMFGEHTVDVESRRLKQLYGYESSQMSRMPETACGL